jgi:Regulator of chromosome condensation (RCC1) repeat
MVDPRALSLGKSHACAIDRAGVLSCWGDNRLGQAGAGKRSSSVAPRVVAMPAGFQPVEVAAGHGFTCVRTSDGRVECLGLRERPLSFAGTPQTQLQQPIRDAAAISAGPSGICVLGKTGGVRCYRMEAPGTFPSMKPRGVPIVIRDTSDAVAVVGGLSNGCIRRANGEVACWSHTEVAAPRPELGAVETLAMGTGLSTCAVGRDARVRCWMPTRQPFEVPGLENVSDVAVGDRLFCARERSGRVRCWGALGGRELDGPTLVEGLVAKTIAVGGGFACAVAQDGSLRCWGSRDEGRLGDGLAPEHAAPVPVPLEGPAVNVSASGSASCAALADGRVQCWGFRYGPSDRWADEGPAMRTVAGVDDALRVFGAGDRACATRRGGRVSCWYAQGATELSFPGPRGIPPGRGEVIEGIADARWVDPHGYNCVVHQRGGLSCFADGHEGPVSLPGLSGVLVAESASSDGFVYLDRRGTVGFATLYPQLVVTRPLPKVKTHALTGLSPAQDVATDGGQACTARRDGQVWCQSLSPFNSLRSKHPRPAERVPTPPNVAEIAMSRQNLCFRSQGGRVGCRGEHKFGALGDGKMEPLVALAAWADVVDVRDAEHIAVGHHHACASHDGGTVSCWGYDGNGQVSGVARGHASCPVWVKAAE